MSFQNSTFPSNHRPDKTSYMSLCFFVLFANNISYTPTLDVNSILNYLPYSLVLPVLEFYMNGIIL